jgi:hypothetical protein
VVAQASCIEWRQCTQTASQRLGLFQPCRVAG